MRNIWIGWILKISSNSNYPSQNYLKLTTHINTWIYTWNYTIIKMSSNLNSSPKIYAKSTHIVKITHINFWPGLRGARSWKFYQIRIPHPKITLNRHPYCWNHSYKNFAPRVPGPRGGLVQNFYNGGSSTVYRSDCKNPEVSISSQFWDLRSLHRQPASQPAKPHL